MSEQICSNNVISENATDNFSAFWASVDRINAVYQKKIFEEKFYLLNSNFDVGNNTFRLDCGLSPARSFEPSVKLMSSLDDANISFNDTEWLLLISYLKNFLQTRFENVETLESYFVNLASDEEIKLKGCNLFGNKAIKLTNGASSPTSFYLSEHVMMEIIKLNAFIIKRRIEMLHNLKFFTFYNNFLDLINKLVFQSNFEVNEESAVAIVCDVLTNSLESYCMRECWFFYKNDLLEDLKQRQFRYGGGECSSIK